MAARKNARFGFGKSSFDVVDGAQGDGVELAGGGHILDAALPDFGGEVERTDGFTKEGGLFVLGFGEGDGNLRPKEGNREAGKAGSRAEVQEGLGVGGQMAGGEETFSKVPADDLFRIADGGEIGPGVPPEEQVEVGGEPEHQVFWRRYGQVRGE